MQPTIDSSLPNNLQKSLLCGVATALALIIVGRLLIPNTAFISLAGASTILLVYGWMAVIWPSRLYRRLAGAVFAGERDYEDFARSGLSDFNAFIMEDFMGRNFLSFAAGSVSGGSSGHPGWAAGKNWQAD